MPPRAPGSLSQQQSFTREAALEGQAGQTAGPRVPLTFFGSGDVLPWRTPIRAPPHTLLETPQVRSGPGTALQSGTHRAPMHSAAPRASRARSCAHTQGRNRRLWGLRQGGFSAVVAQQCGEEARPLLGRGHVRDLAGGRMPGLCPSPGQRSPRSPDLASAQQDSAACRPSSQHLKGRWGTL